jgi:hypothetical protein
MTDTYDKENHWYGWNGGERPVHANTIVDTVDVDGGSWRGEASGADWSHDNRPNDIAAFRITRLYREPRKAREWWLDIELDGAVTVYPANQVFKATGEVIHVREVLPEGDA